MAMRKIGELLDVDTSEMMAFGDNFNDAEMLKTVYYSYIVANAQPGMVNLQDSAPHPMRSAVCCRLWNRC